MKPPGSLTVEQGSEAALVSETFARRFGVLEGGAVEIQTPSGWKSVSPKGIFCDYGNEFGTAAVDEQVWRQWTGSNRSINASLYLHDSSEINAIRDRLRLTYPGLDIRNEGELREVAVGIFDQTFQATHALSVIGLVVAFAGLLLGLLAIFDESARTWMTLRHLGFSTRSFLMAAGLEGAGIGLAAWVSGSLTGLAMGWLLIYVINVQSFGWTLLWRLPIWETLALGLALVLVGYLSGVLSASFWNFKRS